MQNEDTACVNTTVKTQSVQAISWAFMRMLISNCWEKKYVIK